MVWRSSFGAIILLGLLVGCGGPQMKNGRIAIGRSVQQQGFIRGGWVRVNQEVMTVSSSGFGAMAINSPIASKTPAQSSGGESYSVELPIWSPDGTRMLVITGRTLYVVNADGTGAVPITPFGETSPEKKDFAWSPDGKFFAYALYGHLYVVSIDGQKRLLVGDLGQSGVYNVPLGWSEDGKRLIFYVHDQRDTHSVQLYNLAIASEDKETTI